MNKKIFKEYFININFKIMSKCFRQFQILTIPTLDTKENKTIIFGFVMLKYMDK